MSLAPVDRDELAQVYRDVFEVDLRGQLILQDLHALFCQKPDLSGTPEAMNRTVIRAAQREVVEHCMRMINRANGAPEPPDSEAD